MFENKPVDGIAKGFVDAGSIPASSTINFQGVEMKKPTQFKRTTGGVGRKFDGKKSWEDMYDAEWNKYRSKFLYHNPRCYTCGGTSSVVDHITPAKGDSALFKKLDNHLPLCNICHNTITARFDRNYKVGEPIEPKLRWIAAIRSRNMITIRVKVLPSYSS